MLVLRFAAAALAAGVVIVASYAAEGIPEFLAGDHAGQAQAAEKPFADRLRGRHPEGEELAAVEAGPHKSSVPELTNVENLPGVTMTAFFGVGMMTPKPSPKKPQTGRRRRERPFDDIVSRYADQYGVPVDLAHAVITVESNYKPTVRGSAGEIGLMQIKPATARGMGFEGSSKQLFDPETNIKYGVKYLAKAYRLANGTTCGAILRYNAGHGARRMNPVSSAYCKKVKKILAGS